MSCLKVLKASKSSSKKLSIKLQSNYANEMNFSIFISVCGITVQVFQEQSWFDVVEFDKDMRRDIMNDMPLGLKIGFSVPIMAANSFISNGLETK